MLKPDTKAIQERLAHYTRDGELVEIEGVRKDRLHHYRRLVINIQLQTMEQAFPIACADTNTDDWEALVHDFFLHHDAQTPQIWKLPYEFYTFVVEGGYAQKWGKPYLNDLLLFEWVEIEVHTMPDQPWPEFSEQGDVLNQPLAINPEHRLHKLEYPVHKMKPSEITEAHRGNYFLLSWREAETGRVKFMDLSVLHTFAFEKFVAECKAASEVVEEAIAVFGADNTSFIQASIPEFVKQLQQKKMALGVL